PVDISGYAPPPRPKPESKPEVSMGTPIAPEALAATAEAVVPPPRLSTDQQAQTPGAPPELPASPILGRPPRLPDPALAGARPPARAGGGAARRAGAGAYVPLTRGAPLRACPGPLARPMRLLEAPRQAAVPPATQDPRLPPISPTELPHLDVSVNLLFGYR